MQNLKISFIQSPLQWENAADNLSMFSGKIAALADGTDLILLPEMFNTGFSMRPEAIAEKMSGATLNWMKNTARQKSCVVAGSFAVKEEGHYFNRLVWMRPDGSYETYDKHHLFRYGHEHEHYSPGKTKLVVDLKGWKVCPMICYDLRFPVWARNRWTGQDGELSADYDLLIYVANWPEVRSLPWKTLLLARAIENQCYVAGLNRLGEDGNGYRYCGDSAVIDFKGQVLSNATHDLECAETLSLSYTDLIAFRKSFPAGMDADSFSLD